MRVPTLLRAALFRAACPVARRAASSTAFRTILPTAFRALPPAAACAGLLAVGAALAAPPPNADAALAPWFRSLQQPQTGLSCCSIADCRRVEARLSVDHYEVLIDGTWRPVPPETVLERSDNPTGRAVACYTPARGIMCFIKAPDS